MTKSPRSSVRQLSSRRLVASAQSAHKARRDPQAGLVAPERPEPEQLARRDPRGARAELVAQVAREELGARVPQARVVQWARLAPLDPQAQQVAREELVVRVESAPQAQPDLQVAPRVPLDPAAPLGLMARPELPGQQVAPRVRRGQPDPQARMVQSARRGQLDPREGLARREPRVVLVGLARLVVLVARVALVPAVAVAVTITVNRSW